MFKLLDAPSMRSKKIISLTVKKGTKVKLRCEADGNPQPTFTWHKNSDLVSSGFNSSWNVSILIVQYTGEEDFARFVCTAKNRVGWDALTFNMEPARGIFWNKLIFLPKSVFRIRLRGFQSPIHVGCKRSKNYFPLARCDIAFLPPDMFLYCWRS